MRRLFLYLRKAGNFGEIGGGGFHGFILSLVGGFLEKHFLFGGETREPG